MAAGIRIQNLSFSYSGNKPVLKNLSLDVKPGGRLGIIGPSGSGKSTLLLHLNGILNDGHGHVEIDGIRIEKKTLPEIRKLVGLVFQNPDDQLFNPTVEEDVAFGPLNFGYSRDEVSRRVRDALRAMNLEGFGELSSHHLSLGERKRVALATVLAISPRVIAFDEPFSSLDPGMIYQLIRQINDLDATIVIVSQLLLPLIACCSDIAVISQGEILAVGPKKEILKDRELLRSNGLDPGLYHEIYQEYFM
jgi:cobalt/nickel transport system ATP-binding protein